jgi:hypothetical protein
MDYHGRSTVVHTSHHQHMKHPFKLDLILTEPKIALWTDWRSDGLAMLSLTSSRNPELIYHSSIHSVYGLTVYYKLITKIAIIILDYLFTFQVISESKQPHNFSVCPELCQKNQFCMHIPDETSHSAVCITYKTRI